MAAAAASGAEAPGPAPAPAQAARQPRRGPAPIASFDHDVSDESSPETKQSFRLPEIREFPAGGCGGGGERSEAGGGLVAGEQRARSHSTPAATVLPAPRIDISRASSSSHHDSRDSSPEMALFAGTAGGAGSSGGDRLELAFREDGALDLRSSTEELAFLEPAPGEPRPPAPAPAPAPPPPPPLAERRHSRKDSQSSEAALLAVSGRTSRLSSVGSQCSAQSAVSRVSRLSVVSGVSRSPSPHRMLLETSFCGPKPIETDPEICAAAVAEHILEMVKMGGEPGPTAAAATASTTVRSPSASTGHAPTVDARDRREVRTEVTVEARSAPATPAAASPAPAPPPTPAPPAPLGKTVEDSSDRVRAEERRARPRVRREPSEPEVYKSRNRSKDIIRIKLKPDDEEDEEEEEERGAPGVGVEAARKPVSLELGGTARPAGAAPVSPAPSRRRSPSPAGAPVSRKSSFCSLFKSRETVASPDSPSEALRRKRSLTEGRSRSKSRDRAATPSSAGKIRGSVLSLFRTPRRSVTSPSPSSRDVSPGVASRVPVCPPPSIPPDRTRRDLKYYEDTRDGIIHIPLRTPPDERPGAGAAPRRGSGGEARAPPAPPQPRPASAPAPRGALDLSPAAPSRAPAPPVPGAPAKVPSKPIHRTVLPDGSIIIPLHSPTERSVENGFPEPSPPKESTGPVLRPTESPSNGSRNATPTRPSAATVVSSPPGTTNATRASPSSPPRSDRPPLEETRRRRKERLVFTTHVGSREQVFSTQFSITKTPSVTSEISGSFPSFAEAEPVGAPGALRDTHIASPPAAQPPAATSGAPTPATSAPATPQEPPRDSSESEPSSEAATPRAGNDVERRGLVVQESFEEELPYVPTTLPQERPVALPMVPVRDRGGVRVWAVQRPRGSLPGARPELPPPTGPPPPPPTGPPPPPPADKLRIKLPRRPRPASAPRPDRSRTRSGSDTGSDTRVKQEWIDFEEVPERRKQPKRIQTLPAPATAGLSGAATALTEVGADGVVFSYVEPEHCRCECHAHAHGARPDTEDRLPLLDDMQHSRIRTQFPHVGVIHDFARQADVRMYVISGRW